MQSSLTAPISHSVSLRRSLSLYEHRLVSQNRKRDEIRASQAAKERGTRGPRGLYSFPVWVDADDKL